MGFAIRPTGQAALEMKPAALRITAMSAVLTLIRPGGACRRGDPATKDKKKNQSFFGVAFARLTDW